MNREERMKLIDEIGDKFGGPLLVYFVGDRTNLSVGIGSDVFPMFNEHLTEMGKQECINLFLYSTGGFTTTGFALVNLLKEFCNELNVIIPFKAHSTATIICLGANKIIMAPTGQLGPIDPYVNHQLCPINPQNPPNTLGVNVEDVRGFIDMAEKRLGLEDEESKLKTLELLTSHIHPLVLGGVQRTLKQIKLIATKLMEGQYEREEIEKIVEILTEDRHSHDYIISRKEAEKELGLKIVKPNENEEKNIMKLFNEYSNILKLKQLYTDEIELEGLDYKTSELNRAIIESKSLTHVFQTKKEITARANPQTGQRIINQRIISEQWVKNNNL
jgi:hypothetical protein